MCDIAMTLIHLACDAVTNQEARGIS
ncbi:hypothetical protein CBM2609_A120073 [Cupriavidus taiwanensis]|nr:hypothetical protein CBM2609_A120073 [Cupriavidus taiwanensis]SOZ44154.1 hypothetical protein CBM2610_A120072 [Cupriavidus taiwanensis]SOZ98123.1 hypothetical protein CBM2626_A140220 [Cupriavidus taiwanensis]